MTQRDRERTGGDHLRLRPDAAAERAWETLLEQLDYAGSDDAAELAAAHAQLQAVEPDPVDTAQVAAMVAAATGRGAIRPRSWLRRFGTIAASLPGALLLCAAVTVTVLWAGGKFSTRTMDYSLAVRILQRDDQLPAHYSSALLMVYWRVNDGVRALQAIRGEAAASPDLRAAAESGLESLRRSWAGEVTEPVAVAEDLTDISTLLSNTTLDEPARLQLVARVVALARTGLRAIRQMVPVDERVADHLRTYVAKLERLMAR